MIRKTGKGKVGQAEVELQIPQSQPARSVGKRTVARMYRREYELG